MLKAKQNLIVSATEPVGADRQEVWLQKGKNLFNKNDFDELNARMTNSLETDNSNKILYFKCEKNTDYTFQKLVGTSYKRMKVAETTVLPNIGVNISNITDMVITENYIYTTSNTAEYIVFWYYCTLSDLTLQEILDSIQIEQNSIVTSYENYVKEKIWLLNDNNVYVPFKEDKKLEITTGVKYETGRVIDGKIEYCKRVDFGTLPNATAIGINTGIGITSTITHFEGVAVSGTKSISIFNKLIDTDLTNGWLTITTTTNMSSYSAYVDIYYLKN